MVMPDELQPELTRYYASKSHAELVELLKQRDADCDVWRQRWIEDCQKLREKPE